MSRDQVRVLVALRARQPGMTQTEIVRAAGLVWFADFRARRALRQLADDGLVRSYAHPLSGTRKYTLTRTGAEVAAAIADMPAAPA